MRVYSDQAENVAFIETVCEAYTGALSATANGDLVSIYHNGISIFEVADQHYSKFQDKAGNTFSSAQTLLSYLQSIFKVQLNASITYQFSTPVTQWVINHNLGYYPLTKIYSSGNQEIDGEVLNVSTNQVQITFTTPTSGFARIF